MVDQMGMRTIRCKLCEADFFFVGEEDDILCSGCAEHIDVLTEGLNDLHKSIVRQALIDAKANGGFHQNGLGGSTGAQP